MANTSGKSEISEASGIGHSALIIRTWWKCRFQELEARNDNGIDGMIFIKKNTIVTGEIIHVQVKGGSGYKIEYKTDYKDYIGINLGEEYINTHRPRWNLLNEPVILIFVDDQKSLEQYPDTWWIDLKSDDSYSKTAKGVILIHKTKQKIRINTIGEIKKLCGTRYSDYKLPSIYLQRKHVNIFNLNKTFKIQARDYYINWSKEPLPERNNPKLGEILINRVGWKHLTRKGRKVERVLQSFQLLTAAKEIIKKINNPERFGHVEYSLENNIGTIKDYVGLRAFVVFPHRYESVITVVLKRIRKIDETTGSEIEQKNWFYTVYENRRGRRK